MLRVVADENMPAVEHFLGSGARVTRVPGRTLSAQQLLDADVLLVRSVTRVDRALISGTPIKFVGTATSGMEHVDAAWLQNAGIGFSRAAGSNANSVVEYVLSAIANEGDRLERLLPGGTLGIVGYGLVGRAVAARFRALGVACRVYDPWLGREELDKPSSLPEVLACDVICLHAELTRREPWPSYHLLGEQELAGLNGQQLLINASRGPVIDNQALKRCLAQPGAPAVILDVWEGEPEVDRELLDSVRYGTAHIAGYSLDGKVLATRMLCETLCAQFGMTLATEQNPPIEETELRIPPGACDTAHLIRALLAQRYDIRTDDRLLREACGDTQGSVAQAFDALRRNYDERRELAACRVDFSRFDEPVVSVLKALGCAGETE